MIPADGSAGDWPCRALTDTPLQMSEDPIRPDQTTGAPHPRETGELFGHAAAEAEFLDVFRTGRLHHAWLLQGPRGIGKSTCAYRFARFLLSSSRPTDGNSSLPPITGDSLDIPADHPVAVRIRARAEPGLRVITRTESDQGRLRAEIVVDDIRRLADFFHLSAPGGGHRVVIVDSADELNRAAANAVLKMLEEPPAATTILLVSHQPSRLLPTIRSRCRRLRFWPLDAPDLTAALMATGTDVGADGAALSELAGGSVGVAVRLLQLDGLALYRDLSAVIDSMPDLNRSKARALVDRVSQRGAEDRLDLFLDLLDIFLARLVRCGATGVPPNLATADEDSIFRRLAPGARAAQLWADSAAELTARLRRGRVANLDPATLVLDTLIRFNDTARETGRANA